MPFSGDSWLETPSIVKGKELGLGPHEQRRQSLASLRHILAPYIHNVAQVLSIYLR